MVGCFTPPASKLFQWTWFVCLFDWKFFGMKYELQRRTRRWKKILCLPPFYYKQFNPASRHAPSTTTQMIKWKGGDDNSGNHAADTRPVSRSLPGFWLFEDLMLQADWIPWLHVRANIPRPRGQDEHMWVANRLSLSDKSGARLVRAEHPGAGGQPQTLQPQLAETSWVWTGKRERPRGLEEKRRSPVLTWCGNQGERGDHWAKAVTQKA